MLLVTTMLAVALSAVPSLCHQDDDDCRANLQHHSELSCRCSCHMAVVLPALPVLQRPANSSGLALAVQRSRVAVFLNHPERPPRA
jgi:hypothetical protein